MSVFYGRNIMGNFIGFAYSAYIKSQEDRQQPPTEREIILQAQVVEPQDEPGPRRELLTLRETISGLVAGIGQRLGQADQELS
jgi:hypothetical protein